MKEKYMLGRRLYWFDEIPKSWRIYRLKNIIKINNGKNYKNIEVEEGGYPVIGSGGEFARASNFICNEESVLFGRKGTVDKPLFFKKPFWTVDTMFYSTKKKEINMKYLYYCSLCFNYDYYMTSTALPSMTQGDLGNIIIPFPDKSEQNKIVVELDSEVGKINGIISNIEKQIEILEGYRKALITETVTKGLDKTVNYKDTDIAWIDKIPENWQISRLKYMFKIKNGATPSSNNSDFWDGNISWITPADMNMMGLISKGSRNITEMGYASCGTELIPIGSIVISNRAPIGKINYTEDVLCTNQGCKGLVRKGNNKFFYYYFLSFVEVLQSLGRGTTFMELSTFDLGNMVLIIPSEEEQREISRFLDKKVSLIESLITKKNLQIKRLTETKNSLIYEYVTGKKRVGGFNNDN